METDLPSLPVQFSFSYCVGGGRMENRLSFPTWLSEGGEACEYLHTEYLCFVKCASQCLSPWLIGAPQVLGLPLASSLV